MIAPGPSDAATAGPAASPCIKVCTLDPSGALCLGCGRTLREIACWGGASEAERRSILTQLPARLARLSATSAQRP